MGVLTSQMICFVRTWAGKIGRAVCIVGVDKGPDVDRLVKK